MSAQRRGVGEIANKKQWRSISEEDVDIDRISSLPKDVIDLILEFMPTKDAARTCILSSKWRYVWANHPTLVVDEEFWDTIRPKRLSKGSCVDFAVDTVNRMFIHHSGHISEFVLDLSVVRSERHCDVDLWLSFLSKRGVRVLKLENSNATPYTLPSCVFSNSDLTYLSLFDGILKTVKSSTALHKLKFLYLSRITLSSWVLVTPLLSSLTLDACRHTNQFIISAPRLVSLKLTRNDDLNLVPYLACSDIEYIHLSDNDKHQGDGRKVDLMKLLSCWPKISEFKVDGSSLRYLATGFVPEEFPFRLSLTKLILCYIKCNQDPIDWILCILKNSPLLHRLQISFRMSVTYDLDVVNYLEQLNFANQSMEQLRVVKMKHFTASRAELLFMKILLHSAPALERMLVEEDENLNLSKRLRISKELMRLQREFPNAEIIFGPKLLSPYSLMI